MKLSEKQSQFLLDVCLLIQWVHRKGMYCTGGELHRLPETQKILKDQGKSKTTDGKHQKRLAIDLFFFINGKITLNPEDYREAGEFWESLREENRWGGHFTNFVDAVHFERA